MKHQKSELEQDLIDSWNALSGQEDETNEIQNTAEADEEGPTAETGEDNGDREKPDSRTAQKDDENHDDAPDNEAVLEAPAHWPEADRAAFATLPEEMQQFLLRRSKETDADYTRKTQELAEQRKKLAPIEGVSAAWGDYFHEIGVDPAKAINHVMGVERTLRTGTPEQKRDAIAQLVRDYGIANAAAPDGLPQQSHDPAISTLQQQLNAIQGQLQNNQQHAAVLQATKLAEFAAETDENGQLAHPHFAAVREVMMSLARNGQAKSLEEAYDMAVWARPDLREQMLSAREAQQMEERSKSAAKARKAARANVRGSGAPAKTARPKSLEEELAQVWEELSRS